MMKDLWFDQQAFIDLIKQYGEVVYICNRQESHGDRSLGIPSSSTWVCEEVVGYTVVERMSVIKVSGSHPIQETRLVAYLFEPSFNPTKINSTSYLKAQGRYYQMELIDKPYIQKGIPMAYKYRLVETTRTVDGINNNTPIS